MSTDSPSYALAIFAGLMLFGGILSESVLGSWRHLFDLRWPARRWPGRTGTAVKVIGGRIFLIIGVVALLVFVAQAVA